MHYIIGVHGREIIDSRGNPTIEVDVVLEDNTIGRASVPSGASTGTLEAVELRDTDDRRFGGKGVLRAIHMIDTEVAKSIKGMNVLNQAAIDNLLTKLDGTENKSRLGANAILAVSLAAAKAAAHACGLPLYRYLGGAGSRIMPIPMMNVLNGGAHADNGLDIQEFMIVPTKAKSIRDAVRMGCEVFASLKSLLKQDGHSINVGDEGGFAPNFHSSKQALDYIMKAIEAAGYNAGADITIALDVAATELQDADGKYNLNGEKLLLSADGLVKYYEHLTDNYPIISIEDGIAEMDYEGWKLITERLGNKIQLVGDDLFVTNVKMIKHGINNGMANAVLIKPNQIGTLTETLSAITVAQHAGYKAIVSHRSGETEDTTIAHLAVATNCGQIKTGSLARSDRLAKYNELMRIEEEIGLAATYAGEL
jgi:enolase